MGLLDDITISFDTKGSVYFEFNNKTYQVEINKNCDPELVQADYTIFNKNPRVNRGVITTLSNDETNKQMEECEHTECINGGSIPISQYPEEFGHLFSYQTYENTECSDDQDQGYFSFNGTGYEIYERKNGYYNALYDTFILKNNILQFRTKLIGEPALYVIRIEGLNIKCRDTSTLDVYKNFNIVEINNDLVIQKS